MGNCQAAEAATVVIHHPPPANKVEMIYWSISAHEIMSSNPGYYVAKLVTAAPSPSAAAIAAPPARQLKLLRPDDILCIGNVYRLISFEDVLKEFDAKGSAKHGKLLKETRNTGVCNNLVNKTQTNSNPNQNPNLTPNPSGHGVIGSGRDRVGRPGQWKPALHSIAETGI